VIAERTVGQTASTIKVKSIMTNPFHSPVLKVENLAIAYKVRGGEIEAVQNVSFEIARGESLGIVGESGCGKSTVAWSIVNFLGNGYVKRSSVVYGQNWWAKWQRVAPTAATRSPWSISTNAALNP
jgi:ABC-type glutathione transport system ATPase component